ncbi:MAG: hypothetical protein HYZ28_23100 [Myxococcales bacterium]|nr:hypothetical protein [Myxococcales bacterium]
MPDVSSRKFVQIFQGALSRSGRLSADDVAALKAAHRGIGDPTERAAAESILALLRNDRELDSFEVAPTRRALGVLLGVFRGPLPTDLEKVLANAVPQANVRVKHYDLQFDLSAEGPAFPARAVISLERAAAGKTILEANPDRLAISKVMADGREVPFEHKDGRLHVDAPRARKLEFAYTVKPVDSGSREAYGLIRDKYSGRVWTLTWPYNTGALFPSNSAPSDGSTSRVTVRVGGDVKVVGTGNPAGNSFLSPAESPAYAIAFYAANDFQLGNAGESRDGVAVSGFGAGSRVPKAMREAYQKTAREALDFYSSWLGKYDYGNTLSLVEVEGGLGGMEHTAAVAIMMSAARDPEYSKETAAHEVAHHWFGDNLRIKSWGDFWMSEGFTNYATYRFFRHAEGEQRYLKLLDHAKDEVKDALEANPHALSAPAHTDVHEIFDSVPYEMGPWMLRMMECKLGTEKLDVLLREWFQAKRGQAVSTFEFVAFAKAKTGADFGPFFAAWNSIKAVPSFKAEVKLNGTKAEVTLSPTTEVPEGLKVPLRLEGEGGKSKTVLVDPSRPSAIDAGFKVVKARWDPDRTVMAFVR